MGSVYRRGSNLWIAFKGRDGQRECKASGFEIGEEAKAEKLLRQLEARVAAGLELMDGEVVAPRLRNFANRWLKRRRSTVRDWQTDEGRLNLHVLPKIGHMKIVTVHPRHIDQLFHELRAESKLAPHTIRCVYSLTKSLFRDAAIAGHIDSNPCILTATHLGADEYKDPVAQAECRYSQEQLQNLVYSPLLSDEARIMSALGGLAGCRLGEIAGLRWGDINFDARPLHRMTVARSYENATTKTKRIRAVPVHPALAALLAKWKLKGWEDHVGRAPEDSDPIWARGRESRAPGSTHTKKTGATLMHATLKTLDIEKPIRLTHALRTTFISLALESGADHYLIEKVTHTTGRGGRAFDVYAKPNWEALCREVAKISLPRLAEDRAMPLAAAAIAGSKSSNPEEGCYSFATVDRQVGESKVQKKWRRRESNSRRA